eukprot:870011-Amphidinium_carterae.1
MSNELQNLWSHRYRRQQPAFSAARVDEHCAHSKTNKLAAPIYHINFTEEKPKEKTFTYRRNQAIATTTQPHHKAFGSEQGT